MDPVSNPFNPGAGTKPPALVGRDELLSTFDVALKRALAQRPGRSMMPTGLRGVGKTVLLNRFASQADALGFKVAQFEAAEDDSLASMLAVAIRNILYEFDAIGSTASNVVRAAFRVLKSFSITPRVDGLPSFEFNVEPFLGKADSGDLSRDVTDLLISVGEAARSRGFGVLIAIDEVQYLREREFASLISAIHRTTQLSLPIVLVAAGLPQIPALAGEAKSYSERLFTFPQIDSLSDAEAREAIAKPARDAQVKFNDDALSEIIRLTKGYPYFIQEWAFALWNAAERTPITYHDVRRVEASVLDQLDRNFFRVRFDRLKPSERRYLRSMATLGPGPHRSGEVAEVYGAKVESVGPLRSGLIRRGMIYSPQHGDTAFSVPLFDEFMLRAMP